jgi:predicted component of viral defense system (DUF524 family)
MSEPNPPNTEQFDWRRMLTAAERAAMLQDIASVSLTAGARLFPDQPWSEIGVASEKEIMPKSPIEQLGFIEHILPALAQDIKQISRSPLTSAASGIRQSQPERARRVTAAAWMAYARQERSRQSLSETITLLSYDTPENRAVKSFLAVLTRDCRVIALLADAEEETEAAGRAERCVRQLSRIAREEWWEEVTAKPSDWALPPTPRGSLRPDYAAVFRAASQYRRGFCFDWDHPLLTLPPRQTWRLYETWCYFRVFQSLRELGWEITRGQEVFAVRTGRLTLALATGDKSQVTLKTEQGQTLRLAYNQAFAEGRESLSHTMQPDITLSNGERVWILDAKFKPYAEPGEEGEDINQMHAYRDAIVGPRGRSVARAWCLYAGLTGAQNRLQITYGRGAETPVGALCLRPGCRETFSSLREILRQWLAADDSQVP